MQQIKCSFILGLIFNILHLSSSQDPQNINVLFVNEEGNDIAEKAVDVALDYIKSNPQLGVAVEIFKVAGNRTDAKGLLDSLCKTYTEMTEAEKFPDVILDTTMTGMASETVKSFTAALSLPTMSASFGQKGDLRQWRNLNEEQLQYLIQIMPPADTIPEIVRSIVLHQSISNAAILYDESFVMDHKFKSLLQNVATRHVIAAIQLETPKAQLENLRKLDIVNFFILGSVPNIKKVLDAASDADYFNRKFAWHGITQDDGEVTCNCKNATVMFVRPILDNQYQERNTLIRNQYHLTAEPDITAAFYFDFALKTFIAIKNIIQAGVWANATYISCDDYDGKNAPPRTGANLGTYITQVDEPPTYGPLSVAENGLSQMTFSMEISASTIISGSVSKTISLGTWKGGFDKPLELVKPELMKKYTADVVYRVVTVIQKPFIFRDESAPKKFSGYCIDLINEIADILKFDYEIEAVKDGKFGNMDQNGKWNGVVKELMEKRADIGLGSMSVMAERENVIDFTVPYYDLVGITILMKQPKPQTSLFKFLTVLDNNVWLCILAAYFFTSFLMWIFDRWSPYSFQNNREKYKDDEEKREFNLKECLWFCMTSLTPQGGGEAPKNISGRLVAGTWWLFGFIIIASYTANLAAFLTVSRLDSPVESLEDLSKQYKIQYAPTNGSAAMTYFQRMSNIEFRFYEIWKDMSLNDSLTDVERAKLAVWDYPVSEKYTKMWEAMRQARLPNNIEDAVKRVMDSPSTSEGFAFIGDATDIKYLTLTNCELQQVGEEFSRKPYAIAVQQGSPLRDQFNTAILQLLNKRQLERFKERWWTNNEEAVKCEKQEDQSDGISIQNIGGVFIVIFVGIGLACITLAFEWYWYKYRKGGKVIAVQEVGQPPIPGGPPAPPPMPKPSEQPGPAPFNPQGGNLFPRPRY